MHKKIGCLKFFLSLSACIAALCICFSPALAQTSSTGALTGVVTDPSGAVIVGATVTATNVGTGSVRNVTTTATGTYLFSLLPPGDYSVKFEAPGFQTSEVPSITVNVTEIPVLNHSMEVGSQMQQVTVESTAETIQTENATVGALVGGHEVVSLPLSTRNYTQIVDLSPGVTTNVAQASNFGTGTQDVNVNGSNSEENNYQMDGASVVNYITGEAGQENTYGSIPIPNPDSIQEFKVQTGQYDASYGRNPGANVNVLLKTGTNNFHGDAWEFNRNNFFNANDFFNKITEEKFTPAGKPTINTPETLKQNTFGATLGGPVKKDKLFFFGSYQGTRQVNGVVAQGYSPGVNLPAINDYKDLGGLCENVRCTNDTAAYIAYLGSVFGIGGPEHQGVAPIPPAAPAANAIAANGSNINPVAIAILQTPGLAGGLNQGFLVPGAPESCPAPCLSNLEDPADASENQYLSDIDYHISDKNTFSARYFYSYLPENVPFYTAVMPGTPTAADFRSDFAVLRLTTIVTNNLVNEVHASLVRGQDSIRDNVTQTACGVGIIPGINNGAPCPGISGVNPVLYRLPEMIVSGTSNANYYSVGAFSFGAGGGDQDAVNNQFGGADQISWNHGKHSFRTGFEVERDQENLKLPSTGIGSESFKTIGDFLYGGAGVLTAVGGDRGVPQGYHFAARTTAFTSYIQDDIKVNNRLTVNVGLRYEYDGIAYDPNGLATSVWTTLLNQVNTGSFFLNNPQGTLAGYVVQANYPSKPYGFVAPTGATGVFVNPGNNTILPGGPPKDLFAPRFGVAWQPVGSRLVVRAGYGWFYDRIYASEETKELSLGDSPEEYTYPAVQLATLTEANPFPVSFQGFACPATGGTCPSLGWAPRNLVLPAHITGIVENYKQPLSQEYNLNVQYALRGGWVASVGYFGSHSIHLVDGGQQANQDDIVAGAPNTPSGLFGEVAESALPFNDVLNVASVSCPTCGPVTMNLGPGASAVSQNQVDRVPYLGLSPGNGYTFGVATNAASLYDSLQASIQHQLSHGLSFQASYTWSKTFTDLFGGIATTGAAQAEAGNLVEGGSNSGYTQNLAQQYGLAAFGRPQRLVVSYSYDLPYKNANGIMGKVLGGWNISGVTTVQAGLPIPIVTDPAGGTIYGYTATGSTSRAELADPVKCNSLGNCKSGVPLQTPGRVENRINCYIEFIPAAGYPANSPTNPTSTCLGITTPAFALSGSEPLIGGIQNTVAGPYAPMKTVNGITSGCYAAGALPAQYINCGTIMGDSGIAPLSGPTQFNFDMSLAKNLQITEGTHLEFRAEAFNIWNHTQFNLPVSAAVNSSNFGKISAVSVPPRILQFGLKYVF